MCNNIIKFENVLNIGYGILIFNFLNYEDALALCYIGNKFIYKLAKQYNWHFKTNIIRMHKILCNFPNTESIDISYKSFQNILKNDVSKNINVISKYVINLKKLSISDCRTIDDSTFGYFPKLQTLNIDNCYHLTHLLFKYTPNLVSLSIEDCFNISKIINLDKLKELKLNTSFGFDKLKLTEIVLPNLKKLHITNYILTENSKIDSPNLEELYLNSVPIRHNNFFNNLLNLNKLIINNCPNKLDYFRFKYITDFLII